MTPDFLVDFPGLGIFDLPVKRVIFEVFGFPVYWYGLLIAAAIIICLLLATRQAPAYNLKQDDILDTFIALIPLMIVFARLYYVIFEWDYYAADLRRVVDINHGGLAFYGGVIGGVVAILLVARIKKIKLHRLLDHLAVYVPLGQAIGRWGNFFNQEAFGTNTNLPWGMQSNQTAAYLRSIGGYNPDAPVHPTFLYEFIANMIIFAILLKIRKNNKVPYRVTLWYFLLYGAVRFFVESIRTDALYIANTNLRASMVLSALMVIFAIVLLIVLQRRYQMQQLAAALSEEQKAEVDSVSEEAKEPESDFIALDDLDDEPGEQSTDGDETNPNG